MWNYSFIWSVHRTLVFLIVGKYYYEAILTNEGQCRIGWATDDDSFDLASDRCGYAIDERARPVWDTDQPHSDGQVINFLSLCLYFCFLIIYITFIAVF